MSKFKSIRKARKQKISKLQPKYEFILSLWFEGKSLRFIVKKLARRKIICWPSTISRFVKKSLMV
jgi:hypothetical protein